MVWGHCQYCEARLEAPTWEELAQVMKGHGETCPGRVKEAKAPPEGKLVRPISEVVPPEALEGTLIGMEEVLEKLLLVKAFKFRESTYKEDSEYLSLTVDLDGEERIVNTGAERVVQVFRYLKPEDLPVFVTFEKALTKQGRRIYRVKV